MLATAGSPFDSEKHRFEVKWDGVRALAYLDGTDFWLETRNLRPALPRFPELASVKEAIDVKSAVLDGEIIVPGPDGTPDFDLVRSRNAQSRPASIQQASRRWPAVYVVFDVLFRDGVSLLETPLSKRLEHLSSTVTPGERIVLSQGITGAGTAFFQAVAAKGLEGIVGKDLSSPYRPGVRSPDWIKVRNVHEADCVIGGYVPKAGRRFKSLILGLYDDDLRLHYVGHVGTGFTDGENARILEALEALAIPKCPFDTIPGEAMAPARWVTPRLVCSVEYLTLTGAGHLRHPTFRGIRFDKKPHACLIATELRKSPAAPTVPIRPRVAELSDDDAGFARNDSWDGSSVGRS